MQQTYDIHWAQSKHQSNAIIIVVVVEETAKIIENIFHRVHCFRETKDKYTYVFLCVCVCVLGHIVTANKLPPYFCARLPFSYCCCNIQ